MNPSTQIIVETISSAVPVAPTPQVNFEKRIEQYVKLRDLIKQMNQAHKDKMKVYNETLETLEGVLLTALNATGQDSAKTAAGTVYKTPKRTATLADAKAFQDWVKQHDAWDFVDWKANVTAVTDYIKEQNQLVADGTQAEPIPLPGVNYNETIEVGVRRK